MTAQNKEFDAMLIEESDVMIEDIFCNDDFNFEKATQEQIDAIYELDYLNMTYHVQHNERMIIQIEVYQDLKTQKCISIADVYSTFNYIEETDTFLEKRASFILNDNETRARFIEVTTRLALAYAYSLNAAINQH